MTSFDWTKPFKTKAGWDAVLEMELDDRFMALVYCGGNRLPLEFCIYEKSTGKRCKETTLGYFDDWDLVNIDASS